jgi:hypothetical protein
MDAVVGQLGRARNLAGGQVLAVDLGEEMVAMGSSFASDPALRHAHRHLDDVRPILQFPVVEPWQAEANSARCE